MKGKRILKLLLLGLLTLTITACGGGDEDTNLPPTAMFNMSATSGDAPLQVSFNANASSDSDGTISAYAWSFGDGQNGSGSTTDHTYASAGTYTVTLTVTDNAGASGSKTATLTVTARPNQPPTAAMTATPANGIAPLQVTLDGRSSSDADGSITAYDWSFGDGQSATGAVTSHTYTAAGTHTATLTVTDNDGSSDTVSTSITIIITDSSNQPPTAALTATPASGTAPLQVSLDGRSSSDADGSITTYVWSFGDGQSATGAVTSHTYTAAGTYTVTLTVTDSDGGSDTVSTSITVTSKPNQPPTAAMTATPASGTAPLQVSLDGRSSSDADGSITTYVWSFGDGQSATGAVTSHTYTAAGAYTVTLTVTDNDGDSDTASTSITVTAKPNQPPTAAMTATPTNGNAPLRVSLDGRSSSDADGSITAYEWSFGDGQSGTGAVTSHTYTAADTYIATLTVTDDDGDSDTTSTTITVSNPIPPSFSLSGTIRAADNIAVDSDLNDPLAPYASNDQTANAQTVPNPVMLNGFVSKTATGVSGDRFEAAADTMDLFRTSLYAGQYVSLRVASFDAATPTDHDVDIQLFDANLNLVADSASNTEYESVVVPADGEYYIRVIAYTGINKYILHIGSSSLASARAASGWSADFALDQAIVKMRPQAATIQSAKPLGQLAPMHLSHDQPDRLALLSLNQQATVTEAFTALRADGLTQSRNDWNDQLPEETRKKLEMLDLIKQLNQRQDVEAASPNFRVRSMLEPNDTYYSYQEHYRQIRLPMAWNITTGTPATGNVIVAVVDTGIAMDHEDFDGQLVAGYDFISDPAVSNDGDGIDADPNDPGTSTVPGESEFHGTHVAGTIAAASNNRLGVTGIAWGAKIMPLRVLGLGGGGTLYDIIQAARYAAGLSNDSGRLPAQRANIINLSLGGPGFDPIAQDAFAEVRNTGVIVIASAGNSDNQVPFYPAAFDGVVSVSAMDWQNEKAPYSNYGSTVDVGAPGGNMQVDSNGDGYGDGVLSCVINDSNGTRQSNYAFYQGTSMASPHVAGVAALMKAVYPAMTPDDFDTLLTGGELTNDLGAPGRDDIYGYGMIDALKAVEAARDAAGTPAENSVVASSTSIDFGISQQSATITLEGRGAAPPLVTAFSSSEPWLTVTAGTVDGGGLGQYDLKVDRSGLVDAVYSGTVTFSLSDGDAINISVSMRVLNLPASVTGNAGFLHLALFDLSLNNQAQLNLSPVNGRYDFNFQDIAAGDYYLIAGSDVDNDGLICEVGESCGAYPVRNQEVVVTVDRDLSGLDFMATINTGLSEQISAASLLFPGGIPVKQREEHITNLPR